MRGGTASGGTKRRSSFLQISAAPVQVTQQCQAAPVVTTPHPRLSQHSVHSGKRASIAVIGANLSQTSGSINQQNNNNL